MSGWTMAPSLVWFPSLLAPCLSAQPRFHIFTQPQTLPAVLRCTCGAIFFFLKYKTLGNGLIISLLDGPSMCLSSAEQGLQPYPRPWGDLS